MAYYSPLRYPGGKGRLSNYIKSIFKANLICDGYYIEPYAGGAAIALDLLMSEYASKIVINDIDRSIFAFWHSVLNETESLCTLISDTPVAIETWKAQKEVQNNKETVNLLDLGFSTFFLNRVNRSGIIKAGVIGGIRQNGYWKIDARYNKDELIKRIQRVAAYKDRVLLYNLDACELVRKLQGIVPAKSLFYFDPPYYVKGEKLYVNYYTQDDHSNIANMIAKIKSQHWIVSYDRVQEIVALYRRYRSIEYSINYSVAKSSQGREIMVFSPSLHVPSVSIF